MAGIEIRRRIRRVADNLSSSDDRDFSLTDLASVIEILITATQTYFRSIDTTKSEECAAMARHLENARRDKRPIGAVEMAEALSRIEMHLRAVRDQPGLCREYSNQTQGTAGAQANDKGKAAENRREVGPDRKDCRQSNVNEPLTSGARVQDQRGEVREGDPQGASSGRRAGTESAEPDANSAPIDPAHRKRPIPDVGRSRLPCSDDMVGKKESNVAAGRRHFGNNNATEPTGRTTSQADIDKLFG